jgi:hypothetical protein
VIDAFTTSELHEIERAYYAFNFYPDFMTVLEIEAYTHFLATVDRAFGLNMSGRPVDKARSGDPAVLFLARDGHKTFIFRTRKRILKDHRREVFCIAALDAVNSHGHQKHSMPLLRE